ncbi:protein-tyrosine phosphatase-like protein [Mycena metata]|uniref:Protein-tyrosine phosphatase-like protein n=1 Tax=Mycena metata TaxID=1033252 RepID=A0AAD7MDE5_9AGAR|nr:protein-tyrosine phosphatase-like protein [Mycena metata]
METITNPPFTGIHNFRDVGRVVNSLSRDRLIHENFIYRSGRPDDATPTDREKLSRHYGLQDGTVIDLRTKSEHKKQERIQARKTDTGTKTTAPWDVVYINFVGRKFQLNVVKQLKWWKIIWFMTLMICQFRMAAIRILGRNVLGPRGLLGLSQDSLRFCQAEICQALEIFTDFKSYPVLVHCTQGKDRSGLVVMLVLFALGIPLEQVKADYALSNEGLAPVRASMIKEVEEMGMDADYTKAPPEIVEAVWNFLLQEYGGIDAYLDGIGFGEEKRRTLRKLLLV